jgi:hypothetical protein
MDSRIAERVTVWAESIATAVARTTPAPASWPVAGRSELDAYALSADLPGATMVAHIIATEQGWTGLEHDVFVERFVGHLVNVSCGTAGV